MLAFLFTSAWAAAPGAPLVDDLQRLASMWQGGLLTGSEFAAAKAALLQNHTVVRPQLAAAPLEVDAAGAATSGTGSVSDPWVGWEAAATRGDPVYFRSGYFATAGVLVYGGDPAASGPPIVGNARVQWRGAGASDATTHPGEHRESAPGHGQGSRGGGTVIVALPQPTGASARPLLSTKGVRYVNIQSLTLDGNNTANCTLVIDGPSVNSYDLRDVFITGATNISFDICPTWNSQVSECTCANCVIQSEQATIAQVRVGSSNALDLSFFGGVIDGGGITPYNFFMAAGAATLYDIAMGGATDADIYFATNDCFIKVFGCHSESKGMFLKAPKPGSQYADYAASSGSIIAGFEDAGARVGLSILYQHGAPLTIIDVSIAGGIQVDAPGVIFAQGVRMNHAKTSPVVPGQLGWPNATWFGTGTQPRQKQHASTRD